MNVNFDKVGKATVTLTKSEQATLRKSQVLCERLAMQLPKDNQLSAEGVSATNLVEVVAKYCTEPEADQRGPEGKGAGK